MKKIELLRKVMIMKSNIKDAKRRFILQQGFEDPAPAVCPRQYSALVFQPKIVLVWVLAGVLFQSQAAFAALCALLWWSALLPKLNPFSALYNWTIGTRAGAFRLGPAPAPRRGAETEAGATALTIALLIHARFVPAAYVVEAIFLAAALAVAIGGFCLGSFVYHVLRGHAGFAFRTLPWAENETKPRFPAPLHRPATRAPDSLLLPGPADRTRSCYSRMKSPIIPSRP